MFSDEALIQWDPGEIDWADGNFYLIGRAVNAGALEAVSTQIPVPLDLDTEGLSVYIAQFTDGINPVAVSWNGSAAGEVKYEYELWESGGASSEKVKIAEGMTEKQSALIRIPHDYDLQHGGKIYAVVRALDEEAREVRNGVSIMAITDRTPPDIRWIHSASAASSDRVWGQVEAKDPKAV
ncbi:hypothetical protein K7I13_14970 [Brucepastera parasyntrophica]|uniref:hypothetical protein n=1 Tax=Brucepastera parasyntrophica TaxID=2880008 RepID=UPI00210A21DB|nr:hypothetical protein [Brucepastera parasyntrophica]ULQ59733.1 hypothetical protein K7I13_14970 [Brucepastera parasyntrophica]